MFAFLLRSKILKGFGLLVITFLKTNISWYCLLKLQVCLTQLCTNTRYRSYNTWVESSTDPSPKGLFFALDEALKSDFKNLILFLWFYNLFPLTNINIIVNDEEEK